jgi:quercetin dioxygenase-like cupin family protein
MSDGRESNENDPVMDAAFEALALGLRPAELPAAQRERMRARILAEVRDRAPSGTATVRTAQECWVDLSPGLQLMVLQRDERSRRQTVLLRMQPGGELPPHTHAQDEELIVLSGECRIGTHLLRAGDFHRASPGSRHESTTTDSGALVLLTGEYPAPTSIAR